MIPQEATKLHRELYGKLDLLLKSYDTTLSRMELLAVTVSIVGKLMMLQDIRLSDDQVIELVWKNIQAGIDIMGKAEANVNGTIQ